MWGNSGDMQLGSTTRNMQMNAFLGHRHHTGTPLFLRVVRRETTIGPFRQVLGLLGRGGGGRRGGQVGLPDSEHQVYVHGEDKRARDDGVG